MSLSNYSYSYCSSTQYSWCERNDCTTTNYGGTYILLLYNCHDFNFGIDIGWNQTTRWYFNMKVVVEAWLWLVTNQAGGDNFADWWDDVGSQNYDNTQVWRWHNYGIGICKKHLYIVVHSREWDVDVCCRSTTQGRGYGGGGGEWYRVRALHEI